MKKTICSIGLAMVAGVMVLLAREASARETKSGPALKLNIQDGPLEREIRLTTSFAPVVKKVAPSVVTIYSTKTVKVNPFGAFGDNPLFRHFFGDDSEDSGQTRRPHNETQQGLGSGVIVTEDGYILTNDHVVDGADDIRVRLASGKEEFTARVIGTDPDTDVAVIKIDAKGLPTATLADSDKLEVGDVVLAIGNPFKLGQTVTKGIVSAVGRSADINRYEDFIQTDAAINPGNSGGALVDAEGRLVGINSAIFSMSGGSQGIGFAIPVNLARTVMERITTDGKVTRGLLGVLPQSVDPDLAKQFNMKEATGALIAEVTPGSAAAKAGLKIGDVITEINGKKIADSQHLRLIVAQTPPNTKVTVKAYRDGKERLFTAVLDEKKDEMAQRKTDDSSPRRARRNKRVEPEAANGLEFEDLDARTVREMKRQPGAKGLSLPEDGAVITQVESGSPYELAGLEAGEIVVEINHQKVANSDDAMDLIKKSAKGSILMRVWGRGGAHYVVVDMSRARK